VSEETYSESRLLREIASVHARRRDVAKAYRYAKLSGERVDWERVHNAITERWSYFAVEWIRREAKKRAVLADRGKVKK
jgi:hypothetical protein